MIYIYEKTVNEGMGEYVILNACKDQRLIIQSILTNGSTKITIHAYCEEEGVGVDITDDLLEAAYDRWCLEDDFGKDLLPIFQNSERILKLHAEQIIPMLNNVVQLNEWRKKA